MTRVMRRSEAIPEVTEWFRSIGILRADGRTTLPVLERCAACRSAQGCGACAGCRAGQACHRLPPCPQCGVVQSVSVDRMIRHPVHEQLYGPSPEIEVFKTSNGALFLQSVAAVGIIEPVLGLEAEDGDETGARPGDVLVLAGWRRVLAARSCGLESIPVRFVDPAALPRHADVDLVIVSANFQRQKTIDEIGREIQVWKRAIVQASVSPPKSWELRAYVAKMMGVSVRVVEQADSAMANDRLSAAEKRLSFGQARGVQDAVLDDQSIIARFRREQQPGDLRGADIISALTERDEPLLSEERDEVVHESIGRAVQTAAGTFILDVKDVPSLWPRDAASPADALEVSPAEGAASTDAPETTEVDVVDGHLEENGEAPVQVGSLTVYFGGPEVLPFSELPAVDVIISAPSWLEPLARPLLTPAHIPYATDWQARLGRCLGTWRQAIRPGGRLLLIIPVSSPLLPGLPLLYATLDELRKTDWAVGGTIVLDDPSLHGPVYAVPHPDQVLAPKAPVRMIIAAAPLLGDVAGSLDDRWRQSWAAPLPGSQPREVATVEEAALSHLWKYAGPGRRSRWLPEFHPGLLYHLLRIFSRPDATVFLPELGGTNMVRGCMRTGRRIIALAAYREQIDDVTGRIQRDANSARFGVDSLTAVTGISQDDGDDHDHACS